MKHKRTRIKRKIPVFSTDVEKYISISLHKRTTVSIIAKPKTNQYDRTNNQSGLR